MEYNTQRSFLILKEYGRNIHVMVQNLMAVEDRENRSRQAKDLVELMKQFILPGSKENLDLTHKVWDDLFIISDFQLDIDSPFPKPDRSVITKRPEPLGYSYSNPIYRHYGKNIELLSQKINEIENPEERENATIYLGRLMKSFYGQYNKEVTDDVVIVDQMNRISKGKVVLDIDKVRSENLLDINIKERKQPVTNGIDGNNNRSSSERAEFRRPNNNNRNNNNRNNRNRRKK